MWTPATPGRMAEIEKKTKRYPTDLTDEEWARIEPFLPGAAKSGRPARTDLREVLNAIRYLARSGGDWRMLPKDFPPWPTVYWWFRRFVRRFLFQTIHDVALMLDRERVGREASPTGGVIDSQSVKAPEAKTRGYDAGQEDRRTQATYRRGCRGPHVRQRAGLVWRRRYPGEQRRHHETGSARRERRRALRQPGRGQSQKGTFNTLRQAAKRLRSGGRIVNLSTSVVGLKLETYGVYAATKAAVETMTAILSKELRGRSITVNAVAPGPTGTELFLNGKSRELVERLAKMNPLERLGTPDDIAAAVAFLTGPDGAWINGQVLRANGGMV